MNGLVEGLIGIGVVITIIICGFIWLGIWLFSSDEIKVKEPLKPIRVELVIEKNNKIDSVYVYKID